MQEWAEVSKRAVGPTAALTLIQKKAKNLTSNVCGVPRRLAHAPRALLPTRCWSAVIFNSSCYHRHRFAKPSSSTCPLARGHGGHYRFVGPRDDCCRSRSLLVVHHYASVFVIRNPRTHSPICLAGPDSPTACCRLSLAHEKVELCRLGFSWRLASANLPHTTIYSGAVLLPPLFLSPLPGCPVSLPSSAPTESPFSKQSQPKREHTISSTKRGSLPVVLSTHWTAYLPRPQIPVTTLGVHALAVGIHTKTMSPLWCFFVRTGLVDGGGLPATSALQGPCCETWWKRFIRVV